MSTAKTKCRPCQCPACKKWNYGIDRILNCRFLASAEPQVIEALFALMDDEITQDEFDEVLL